MILSSLGKTYIFDLDGTIVLHNGHKNGGDKLLPGVSEFFATKIKANDTVIFMTAREEKYADTTKKFLMDKNIHFDHIIFGLPHGERLLFNDSKQSGLLTAYAINLNRNEGLHSTKIVIDENI